MQLPQGLIRDRWYRRMAIVPMTCDRCSRTYWLEYMWVRYSAACDVDDHREVRCRKCSPEQPPNGV